MISRSLPKHLKIDPENVRQIGLIFKTHLDLGFTDLASVVYQRYMEEFMPAAVQRALASRETPELFVWTTGSWLVEKYLSHSKGKARRDFEMALGGGLIRWHALPFTFQIEALDEDLLEVAFTISARLDKQFGVQTRAAKMTDVPGHTRGLIPTFAAAGVDFLHIGVNPASQVPAVPRLFRWRHPGGAEIMVCFDGTYGGFCPIPGDQKLFAISMTGDNAGPPSEKNVHNTYAELQSRFPHATIQATTLESLADSVRKQRSKLPVITSEIGDTWIHGYGSDPWKMGAHRRLAAARRGWVASGSLNPESTAGKAFDNHLLLAMEHTWGLDEKTWMHNGHPLSKILNCYRKEEFEAARHQPAFRRMEASWNEQRSYIHGAVAALPARLRKEAETLLAPLNPPKHPQPERNLQKIPRSRAALTLGEKKLTLLPNGALEIPGRPGGWLGLLHYEAFGEAEYDQFLQRYVRKEERYGIWAPYDFAKPGCGSVIKQKADWTPKVVSCKSDSRNQFFVELKFPTVCTDRFGAPATLTLEFTQHDAHTIDLELCWFDKPATRVAEALWLSFRFPVTSRQGWWIHKLGGEIDPFDVVQKGSRHLHIAQNGVGVRSKTAGHWTVSSQEAALVAPGTRRLVDFRTSMPDPERNGFSFNLYNNTWGTNFPMWYEENAMFKFRVQHSFSHGE